MQYYEANLLTSAARMDQWPDTNLPELIMTGRSNVGKSSLINALVNRKKLAYVGQTPGKTRLLNFYEINSQLVLVDAPGYGFANRNQKELELFGEMMEDYFSKRKQLKLVVQLVDMRHKPTKDDVNMMEFARATHLPVLVIATKKDKAKSSEKLKNLKVISETLGIPSSSIVCVSSEKKEGLEEAWNRINEYMHD